MRLAAEKKEVATGVDVTEVSGMQPEVAHCLEGLLGRVVVTLHEHVRIGWPQQYFADLASWQFHIVGVADPHVCPAVRFAVRIRNRGVNPVAGDIAAAFGKTIEQDEGNIEALLEQLRYAFRQTLNDTDRYPNRMFLIQFAFRLLAKQCNHGPKGVNDIGATLAHAFKVIARAEATVNDGRHVCDVWPHQGPVKCTGMKQGHH